MTGGAIALVTLGCGRNDVDTDQVGGSLIAAGYTLVDEPADADCILVNTCTFIEPARRESVDTILAACDTGAPVLVIGCMAQQLGPELAQAMPEVAGVLGFADYPRLPAIVGDVLGGRPVAAADLAPPVPRGLPLLAVSHGPSTVPTGSFPLRTTPRGPWAYLKIAGGCDRVCTFCTIPSYRGRFASRGLPELEAELHWLVERGVREVVCVSENTTSWGKDLPGGRRSQVDLVALLGQIDGLERARLLYLQPAELIPELLDAMAASAVVAPYYDLSLQHASESVLQRMARSGSPQRFLDLIAGIRRRDPSAVFRSSFIVGFPGETAADVDLLESFLLEAGLDWAGFFTFSVEDTTPSASMPDQVPSALAMQRRERLTQVAESVAAERAEAWVGRQVQVLVEGTEDGDAIGRCEREAPETDGEVRLPGAALPIGRMVAAVVSGTDGVDLVAQPLAVRV